MVLARRYSWIVFDADGTLFDYDAAESAALSSTFEEAGLAFDDRTSESYRRINSELWRDFEAGRIDQLSLRAERFRRTLKELEFDADPHELSAHYLEQLGRGTQLIAGAEELLERMHGQVQMILLTNGLADVQNSRFALTRMDRYFDDIVISEEVGVAKPDPKIFEIATRKVEDLDLAAGMIVGDSLTSDIRGGNAFGIDTCWFNPNQAKQDVAVEVSHEIRELSELVDIVGI